MPQTTIYAVVQFTISEGRDVLTTCTTLEEALSIRDRIYGRPLVYYAHTEKSGYNTFIVLDSVVRKSDGTPL